MEICPTTTALTLPAETSAEYDEFIRLDTLVRQGLVTFIETGIALAEIHDRELWRAGGHESWAAYCKLVGGLSKIHGNRLIRGAKISNRLAQVKPAGFTGATVTPRSEWQIRPLCRLSDPEEQVKAWYRAVERSNGQPTESTVAVVVKDLLGDKRPGRKPKQDCKQRLLDAFSGLRDAVRAKLPQQEIELKLTALELLLQ